LERLLPRPGTYALILACPAEVQVRVGALGQLRLTPGWYAYLGSAFGPGGVRGRCLRHLDGGRAHWHIDHLRRHCDLNEIWVTYDPEHREHQWAAAIGDARGGRLPFPGFGASDCGCESHLVFACHGFSFAGFKRRLHRDHPGHGRIHRVGIDYDPVTAWAPRKPSGQPAVTAEPGE